MPGWGWGQTLNYNRAALHLLKKMHSVGTGELLYIATLSNKLLGIFYGAPLNRSLSALSFYPAQIKFSSSKGSLIVS